jgi:hypothetical protein
MKKELLDAVNSYLSTVWNPIGLDKNVILDEYIDYAIHIIDYFSGKQNIDSIYLYLKFCRTKMMMLPENDHGDWKAAKYITALLLQK